MFTQHVIKISEHKNWFNKMVEDSSHRLMIVESPTTPVGFVQFSNGVAGGVSDWGFYLAPRATHGIGTKFGALCLKFAFRELRLHKVCGQALDFNSRSISFHARLGFQQEALLRQQFRISNVYHSILYFGILKNEWEDSLPNVEDM